nr:Gly-rich RNA binding protein [Ipomoea batatas]
MFSVLFATRRSRAFRFVMLRGEQSMRDAIEGMNGQSLDGRSITVNEAQSQGSGGGGGFRDGRRERGGSNYGRREGGDKRVGSRETDQFHLPMLKGSDLRCGEEHLGSWTVKQGTAAELGGEATAPTSPNHASHELLLQRLGLGSGGGSLVSRLSSP